MTDLVFRVCDLSVGDEFSFCGSRSLVHRVKEIGEGRVYYWQRKYYGWRDVCSVRARSQQFVIVHFKKIQYVAVREKKS